MFPMNGNQQPGGDRSMLQRYIDWLLSQLQGQPTQAVGQITNQPMFARGIVDSNLNIPAPRTQEPTVGANVSASDLLGSNAPGSYTLPDWARGAPGSFYGVSAPQPVTQPTPSGIDRNALMGYLQNYLNIGGYFPPGPYPREYFNELATAWEAAQASIATNQKEALYNPIEDRYVAALAANPEDEDAQKMIGLFEEAKQRDSIQEILEREWELSADRRDHLEEFWKDYKNQRKAEADIVAADLAVAEEFGLPMPSDTWDINPDIAAQLWTRQKTGLTEKQAQERELLAAQEAMPYFAPRTREEITADVMRQYQAENKPTVARTGGLERRETPVTQLRDLKTARAASTEAVRSGASADRAESAGRAAVAQANAPKRSFAFEASNKSEDDKKRKEMQALIENQIRAEGYMAMRGEKFPISSVAKQPDGTYKVVKSGGGEAGRRVKQAEERVRLSAQYEVDLANKIAQKLQDMYGSPYEVALEEAKKYVMSQGRSYDYPGGPTGGYPNLPY